MQTENTVPIEKIVRVEEKVSGIEKDIKSLCERVDIHGKQIDNLDAANKNMEIEVVKIQKDVESINKAIDRVEKTVNKTDSRIEDILNRRVDDHFGEPLRKYRKIAWAIAASVLAFLAGVLIKSLFPGT